MPPRGRTKNNRCVRCDVKHGDGTAAALCCLFAPKAMGWCAWCGAETRVSFCSEPCAISYREDVFASKRKSA